MALHVALTHETAYRYDRQIGMGPQVVRLRPAPHCRTPILSYSLTIEPKTHFINWQQDPFGNFLARVVLPEETDHFSVTVDLVADMAVINPFDFFVEESAKDWPFDYDLALEKELGPYLEPRAGRPAPRAIPRIDRPAQEDDDRFPLRSQPRARRRRSAISSAWSPACRRRRRRSRSRSGSCRDSAWLLVQILRNLGLAARFVSGYLIQLVPDVKPLDGPAGATADFTDLHAWAEVYLPGAGWIGLDPTSGLLAGEGHIPLAATPHPSSAAPITGSHEQRGGRRSRSRWASTRIRETPRVTKPYSEETWQAIVEAGHEIDKRLVAGDVRLTMGGEPTFVAVDDMEGARVEHGGRRPQQAALCGGPRAPPASAASRRAACCTTARASGIPASSCRAGPSPSIGARTGSRCGRTATSSRARSSRARRRSTTRKPS